MMRLRSCRRQFIACLVLMLSGVGVAHAGLKNCDNLNANPGDYKVVLDDFAFASEAAQANAQLAALRETLQFNFTGQLDLLRAAARQLDRNMQVPMRLVFCAGRQPSLDGSDFTAARAEQLSDERVVVEMWGKLDLSSAAGGTPAPSARIGYVIPPVQHYVDEEDAPPVHVLAYPKTGSAGSIEELENLPELPAFALIGLGTKAAKANRYDLAVWAFNRAEAGIADAKLAGVNPRLEALLSYVKRAACETRSSARKDPSYKGPLTLLPAQPCGGVEL
jgi:DNA-directed RNA polymerase subunit K/omega